MTVIHEHTSKGSGGGMMSEEIMIQRVSSLPNHSGCH